MNSSVLPEACNAAEQTRLERLAQDIERRARALEVLDEPPPRFTYWSVVWTVGFWGCIGWFITERATSLAWVGAVASVGLFLSLAMIKECRVLRRRLDAALVLLRTASPETATTP